MTIREPLFGAAALLAALSTLPATAADLTGKDLSNPTAYIPPQCYTKTVDAAGLAHNPCYTCHVRSRRPNAINDFDLQLAYSFPAPARENRWTNLFVDRSAAVAAVPDDDILDWVRTDNYRAPDGTIRLAAALADPPAGWDADGDRAWNGFVPDAWFDFDDAGFDTAPDGTPTGWRAFAYDPLPGTFWPTNGSTDDVLIRLPEAYRETAEGQPDRETYVVNLAIVEALINRADVPIAPVDEKRHGIDLDNDGTLSMADKVVFRFRPTKGQTMRYAGRAGLLQDAGEAPLAAGLYPLGTEFLHTVRYIDVDDAGRIAMAPRVKEVRYMLKTRWQTYADLQEGGLAEAKERSDFPDRIALFDGDVETGISNGAGWRLQGFIEDADGALRPQTFEETVFCMGCHGGVGVTDDSTFAFPRKLGAASPRRGWWHWTQEDGLVGVPDRLRADGSPEYAFYLKENGAGDEFRGNTEVMHRFFAPDGALKPDELDRLRSDVATLLYPSRDRALSLNKAYREIVREQSYIRGRDATILPQETVHRSVEADEETGIEMPVEPWYRR
ncbi:MAG: hypothetical protein KDJ77_09860 [Rhodobiaceae bacterium]|nr:hypothetical protein [Rhodobiaceae bacterium]